MASASAQPVKISEYLRFKAPEGFRDELIDGEIVVSPEPKVLHYQVADNLYKLLSAAAGRKNRVAQRINLRFFSLNSMPSPDVFVISLGAFNTALLSNKYPEGKDASLAVEVLSPSNRKREIDRKVKIYRHFGIETWIVDPKQQEVKVYKDACQTDKLAADTIPFGGKSIALADIFKLM